jgi:hypothetical protein
VEIHKPKPWASFREFLKEYGIIVVGVLTALGAEAVVEQLHWRHQVELAHRQIRFDMKRVMAWSALQDAVTPCVGARLDELETILQSAQLTGRLPTIGRVPDIGSSSWVMRSWSGLTYGQVLAHMPTAEQLNLTALELTVEAQRTNTADFRDEWSLLQSIAGPARPIAAPELVTLKHTLARARRHADNLRGGAVRGEYFVIRTGLLSKSEADRAWREGIDVIQRRWIPNEPLCRSIPTTFAPALNPQSDHLTKPVTPPGAATQLDDIGVRGEKVD